MNHTKTLLLLLTLLLLTAGCIQGDDTATPKNTVETHGTITFNTNYDDATQQAINENKPLLIYFWADWCVWCNEYHENVFPQQDFKTAANNYVRVAIDVDTNNPLIDTHRVRGPPVLILLDPETDTVLHRITGYPSPDAIKNPGTYTADILTQAANNYKTTPET